jgi:diphthamide biosynthesis enzyme Dph1/Dph2-like protein
MFVSTSFTNIFHISRYYLIERAKDAQVVGILIGTLGVGMAFKEHF